MMHHDVFQDVVELCQSAIDKAWLMPKISIMFFYTLRMMTIIEYMFLGGSTLDDEF